MNIEELIYNNEKYYYINEYEFKFGKFYKFANDKTTIFFTKDNGKYNIVTKSRILKKLKKEFENIEIKDIV